MPNHCYDTLTIEGSEADIDHLRGRLTVDDHGFCHLFESLLPMPDELRNTTWPSPLENGTFHDEAMRRERPLTEAERNNLEALRTDHGHADWYSWQREHWGTKWGDCETEVQWDDPLVLEFWTPWGPPTAGMSKIAAMYPSLRFHLKYDEPNCELRGTFVWAGGKLVRESREVVVFEEDAGDDLEDDEELSEQSEQDQPAS
jgi:hypothetical protein